jgi:hypothetical protein
MSRTSTNYAWIRFFGSLSALQRGLKNFVDLVDAKFYARGYVHIPFTIPATELSAGTTIELVSPVAGTVITLKTIIQTAIVTGGAITAKIGTTDITGLSITVADSATKGTVQTDNSTATNVVVVGDRIQIVPAAAFNGGGAVSGVLTIQIA